MVSAATIQDPASVLELRRALFSKPEVVREDLAALVQAGREAGERACGEFAQLLGDVATDLLVERTDPPRYVRQADADWLIALLRSGPGLAHRAEYGMLLGVIRYAVSVPANLAAFSVGEIERFVVLRGCVTAEDLEALRLAVYAATEGSSLHVTRLSAEVLLRMAHETAGATNAAGFDDFVAKAVGNYLMGVAFHWTPSAEEERRLEAWLDEKPSFGSFLRAMFEPRIAAPSLESELREENAEDAKEILQARRLDPTETDWLLAHLGRDGRLTSPELSLLEFLKKESGSLPPNLAAVLERQAA